MSKIGKIASAIPKCEIIATVTFNSGITTYGNGGKYVNIHLDDGEPIKMTVFGESVSKVADLQVLSH